MPKCPSAPKCVPVGVQALLQNADIQRRILQEMPLLTAFKPFKDILDKNADDDAVGPHRQWDLKLGALRVQGEGEGSLVMQPIGWLTWDGALRSRPGLRRG